MRDIVGTRMPAYTSRSRFQQGSFQQLKVLEGWGMNRRRITISIAGAVALIASLFGLPATGLAAGARDKAQSLCIAPHPPDFVWEIRRAHVRNPVTGQTPMPSSA